LLIDRKDESYLFKHGFFDENILALKIDSKDEYAFLVNETRFDKELNSSLSVIEFLNKKYIEPSIKSSIQNQTGLSIDKTDDLPTIEIYEAPNYNLKKIAKSSSFFGAITEQYLVEFQDGQKGEVFHKLKNNNAYFKEKKQDYWGVFLHTYKDLDFCIKGLHYFLKKREILRDGLLGSFV